MIINKQNEDLHIYMLNVGQGDTTIVVSPQGNVIIIDAMKPQKVRNFLTQLGNNDEIEHLIITHPHDDHYGACNYLAKNLNIKKATLAPFWHAFGMGPVTYREIIAKLETDNVPIDFLSGYSRWYPDDIFKALSPGADLEIDPDQPFLELLGPSNSMVRTLEEASVFNARAQEIKPKFEDVIKWKYGKDFHCPRIENSLKRIKRQRSISVFHFFQNLRQWASYQEPYIFINLYGEGPKSDLERYMNDISFCFAYLVERFHIAFFGHEEIQRSYEDFSRRVRTHLKINPTHLIARFESYENLT